MGMTMGEIFNLKELADDCEQDKVYEFLFVAPAIQSRAVGLSGQSAGDQVTAPPSGVLRNVPGDEAEKGI